jgi:soluble lytic murein transglycosylase-like protein
MLNFGKPRSYSQVLSAAICFSFSFSVCGQNLPGPPRAPQPQAPEQGQPEQQRQDAIFRQQQSIAIQQQSIGRQRTTIRQQLPPSLPAPPVPAFQAFSPPGQSSGTWPPNCPPVAPMLLQNAVHKAAATYNVTPSLINAVIRQESDGYPCAVSDKGAMGLMQLMPATAVQLGASQPFDVTQNVTAGTRLLSELMQRYKGDLNRVLAAYNAGPAAVDQADGPPPFPETVNYIHSVLEQIKTPFDPKLFASPIR